MVGQAVEYQSPVETAPNRTQAAVAVTDWAALSRREQDRIEGILARNADLFAPVRQVAVARRSRFASGFH